MVRSEQRNSPARRRQISGIEWIAVAAVIGAVIAMAIWFVFLSSGGIGPGTV
jgi:hypothetical protein